MPSRSRALGLGCLGVLVVPLVVLGCRALPSIPADRAVEDQPVSVPATAPASGPALTQPAALPEIPPEPPAPTAAVPPRTPKVEGWISDMVAIDEDRAIVRFLVPGPDHEKQWWIALMRRDGSLAWVQSLSGQLAANEGVTGIARQGRPRPRRWPRPEPNRGERSSDSLALVGELDELHRASAPRAPHHVDREHPL